MILRDQGIPKNINLTLPRVSHTSIQVEIIHALF